MLPLQSWWDVFVVEPIAIRLVWLIVRVVPGLRPNTVTGISLVVAVGSAYLFCWEQYVWAALAYQLYYILDNVDGILARLTDRTSELGGVFDNLTNILAYSLNVAALFLSMTGDVLALIVGALLLVVFIMHLGIGQVFDKPEEDAWANVVPERSHILRRHRLLYPMCFPDRHALLFLIGPLGGFAVVCGALILLVEMVSFMGKMRRILASAAKPADVDTGRRRSISGDQAAVASTHPT